jgi:hypothetical protein
LEEGLGRGGRSDLRPVDEVNKTVALRYLPAEAFRPSLKRIERVAGGLFLGATAKPSINEIARDVLEGREKAVIDERNGDAMTAQQLDERRGRKAPVANFDDVANLAPIEVAR